MKKYILQLNKLKERSNYRVLPDKKSEGLIDLSSNDYLGINHNSTLHQKFFLSFCQESHFGSGSSRLLGANLNLHSKLESFIAESYNAEGAIFFNSGYHANIGVLSSIPDNKDLIIADKLIHASVIDGARLSRADFVRYKHLDYDHLEQLLIIKRGYYDKVFIVSETVFSMDGDVADIKRLVELREKYGCFLYLDEAHAVGVRGINGLGCAEEYNSIQDVDFIVGTFGKALASVGAYVVCKHIFKEYLINFSRSFIYTTALPPINMAWSLFIFEYMQTMKDEREKLKNMSIWFGTMLNTGSKNHIIPFIVGSSEKALNLSKHLFSNGYNVLPVRHPTVPKGLARLRFSLNAGINCNQLLYIYQLLNEYYS
ncbi:8-amino-7-oxononanoate synthase [Marinilabiliaceae bacterium ANBcel2]|nr:8-amino-7-oxononanoate synthase [Marinilabiliaceae bacterium ANBcel2]